MTVGLYPLACLVSYMYQVGHYGGALAAYAPLGTIVALVDTARSPSLAVWSASPCRRSRTTTTGCR